MRVRLVAAALVLLITGGLFAGPAGAAPAPAPAPAKPHRSVLVLSLPTLAWSDLYTGRTPNLDRLLSGSAVAALSVRDVVRSTGPADGYAAVSAGTRARGVADSGEVLQPDEDYFGIRAGAVFRRNTGLSVDGGVVNLDQPEVVRRNDRLDFDAVVGALGQALEDAQVPRAVIANADGRAGPLAPTFAREGASALADESGVTPAGAVSRDLLMEDPTSPFGLRYDPDAVLRAFDGLWPAAGVVMVEGSDLARVDRYRTNATPAQQVRLRNAALVRTDQLVGQLLERVDLAKDAILVVAPYHSSAGVHLTVTGVHAPGVTPGLLRSASTRRAGFVELVDVAPTILALAGVNRPDSMEGRAFERTERGAATGQQRAHDLVVINRSAKFRDHMVGRVATIFVVLQALLLAAALASTGRRPGIRRLVGTAALGMLGFLPATYLAGLVQFYRWNGLAYWGFIAAVSIAVGVGAEVAGRRHRFDPLLLALGVIFGLLVVDMLLGAPLQLNTVFGYSPTVGGRFAGMGNLAYGQFAGAAFLIAGLLLRRLTGRRIAVPAALGVLGLAIVIDGSPMWGSDVGGVLAFVPAIGVTASIVSGRRIRLRSAAIWGAATLVVISAFAALDMARPADQRTHLGRLVESISHHGLSSLTTVVTRKLSANLGVLTSTIWTAMVPIALCFVVYLLWKAPGSARSIRETLPEVLGALAVVGFLGFALNDSGIAVPGVMLGVVNASLVYLTVRALPPLGDDP
jgi:hypothetical protein